MQDLFSFVCLLRLLGDHTPFHLIQNNHTPPRPLLHPYPPRRSLSPSFHFCSLTGTSAKSGSTIHLQLNSTPLPDRRISLDFNAFFCVRLLLFPVACLLSLVIRLAKAYAYGSNIQLSTASNNNKRSRLYQQARIMVGLHAPFHRKTQPVGSYGSLDTPLKGS